MQHQIGLERLIAELGVAAVLLAQLLGDALADSRQQQLAHGYDTEEQDLVLTPLAVMTWIKSEVPVSSTLAPVARRP